MKRIVALVAALALMAVVGLAAEPADQAKAAAPTAGPAATPGPGYHVIKKLALGGEGGWDALTVDSAAGRLYLSRGNARDGG